MNTPMKLFTMKITRGYAANEYPDEELLTSDDGRMMSEDSSQEDEDYW